MRYLFSFSLLLIIATGFFVWPVFCLAEASPGMVINEIMYNLEGADEKHEWVEILNVSESEIELTKKWRFNDGENHLLNEPPKNGGQGSLIIPAGGYAILADDAITFLADHPDFSATVIDTVMSLKNSSSTLKLIDAEGNEVDSVIYENTWGANGNGISLEKINPQGENAQSNWGESILEGGTPGIQNSIFEPLSEEEPPPEEEPLPIPPAGGPAVVARAGPDVFALAGQEIQFSAAGSYTNIGCLMSYFWNFGDGTTADEKMLTHAYQFAGKYIVILTVSCGQSSDTDTLTANIYGKELFINEFLPHTTDASGKSAWIELYNSSEQIIDLTNWRLNTGSGDSQPFVFPPGSLIAPKQFLVLIEPISSLIFNPMGDSIQLSYPHGLVAQEIKYTEAQVGYSINRTSEENYLWSATPTPGLVNLVSSLPLAGQEASHLNELTKISQATVFQPEPPLLPPAQNVPAIVQKPATEEFSPLPETPKEPEQKLFSQDIEPTGTSAATEQTLLAGRPFGRASLSAGMSTHQFPKSKTAKLILNISIALSFALLAGWATLMLRKALRK